MVYELGFRVSDLWFRDKGLGLGLGQGLGVTLGISKVMTPT